MNRDERSYQLSHAYDRFLDATGDHRIKTRKNWVPASSDLHPVIRSKVETSKWGIKVLVVIHEFSTCNDASTWYMFRRRSLDRGGSHYWFWLRGAMSRKLWKIEHKSQLTTNRKSYNYGLSIFTKVDNLEWPWTVTTHVQSIITKKQFASAPPSAYISPTDLFVYVSSYQPT